MPNMYKDSINVFTDANEKNIGYHFNDVTEKKQAKYKSVTLNELDAIRYAAKKVKKMVKGDETFYWDTNNITFYCDNTNAIKAVQSILMDTDSMLPPDKDRINLESEEVKYILSKIKKHFDELYDYGMMINIIYSPAHSQNYEEGKYKFKQFNSKDTVYIFNNMSKKHRKRYINKLIRENNNIDQYIKVKAI